MVTNQGKKLAKISIAKSNNIASGAIKAVDGRVSPLSQSFGITYDMNNNIEENQAEERITTLENQIATANNDITTLQSQITTLLSHTHDYDDNGTNQTTQEPNL